MPVVRLSTPLRKFSDGKPEVEVEGKTLLEALENLNARAPGFIDRVIENGEIKRFVNIFVNNEDVRFAHGLKTKLSEKDVVSILPAVSGG